MNENQCINEFINLSSDQNESSVSIGPVVKYYWKILLQLSSQKARESTRSGQQSPSLESQSITRAAANTPTINTHKTQSTSMTNVQKNTSSTPASTPHHERESTAGSCVSTHAVSCRMVESAPVPCEACACVQTVMKESGEALVSLSSLWVCLAPCRDSWQLWKITQQMGRLSACDISQLASEQRRDMSRVGKHALEVRGCVYSL
ncbi:hypothetical protein cypCar_00040362 [Cyprinus carpio]|nr:hypothetical protein cypCar_00040362 [Cyprinus carpio]